MEMARRAGIDPDTTWALLSFTALEWDEAALERVSAMASYTFLTVHPLAWARPGFVALDRRDFPYHDVMASCDIVVTKPGYGVLSDCAVNSKPIVYVEREHFREYPILEAAIRRHLRHIHLPAQKLYRGELGEALSAVRHAAPPLELLRGGGDDQAAEAILDLLG